MCNMCSTSKALCCDAVVQLYCCTAHLRCPVLQCYDHMSFKGPAATSTTTVCRHDVTVRRSWHVLHTSL